jgi:hypothetical protein
VTKGRLWAGAVGLCVALTLHGCALSHEGPQDSGQRWPGCMPPIDLSGLSTPEGQRAYTAMLEAACGPDDDGFPSEMIINGSASLGTGVAVAACACSDGCFQREGPCPPDPTYGVPRTCFPVRDALVEGGLCAIRCEFDRDCPGDMRCVSPGPDGSWGAVDYPTICARVAPASPAADGGV